MKVRITEQNLQDLLYESGISSIEENNQDADIYHTVQFHHAYGQGTVKNCMVGEFQFHSFETLMNQGTSILIQSETPVLEMQFNIEGYTESKTPYNRHLPLSFKPKQHNFLFFPEFEGVFNFENKLGKSNTMFEVHFTTDYLSSLLTDDTPLLHRFLDDIAAYRPAALGSRNLAITPIMMLLIEDIVHCKHSGFIQRLFIESRILELLRLQLEMFTDTRLSTSLSKREIDKMHEVKRILELHVGKSITLRQISLQVGLNDFKLKKGFKEVFGTTVLGYFHQLQMERARFLLAERKESVAAVADFCGYKHPHHFTTAFKKRFGVLPSSINKEYSTSR